MPNERLRSHLLSRGIAVIDLAAEVEVDPKTVERWITQDRVPHRRHRWATAKLLKTDEAYLWPSVADDHHTASASQAELVQLYPHRGLVPGTLWSALFENARETIDILVYSGLFVFDTHPAICELLTEKAGQGVKVRILLGDEDSDVVRQRGDEEGIGADLGARIRLTRAALRPVLDVPGIEIRTHSTILYSSLYRFDADLLANVHVYGAPAPQNPVLHLRRVPGGRLFDHFIRGLDDVWATSTGG
jgi:hypothetical protein